MNDVRSRRGKIALTRWNAIELVRDPLAPNAVAVGETLTITESGNVVITIPSIDPSWAKLQIIWRGTDTQSVRRQQTFTVPLEAGTHLLGDVATVQGRLAGRGPRYAMRAIDTSGRVGTVGAFQLPTFELGTEQPPVIWGVSITAVSGLGTVGAEHEALYSFTGNPDPNILITWQRDGAPIADYTLVSPSDGRFYTPVTADAGTNLTAKIDADNSQGSASATSDPVAIVQTAAPVVGSVTISGSGQVGSALVASVTMSNAGTPVATIGLVWKKGGVAISGATGTSYTPVSGDVGSTITVTATATNSVGTSNLTSSGKVITTDTDNEIPVIISATLTGGNIAGSTHGVIIDATGTPPPTYTYQWKLGTSNAGTGATYVSPADSTAALSVIITPSNTAGVGDPYTAGPITLVRVAPQQLTAAEWSFTTSTPAVGVTQLETISIPASKGATDLQWTNTQRATDQEAVDAGEFEITTLIGTTNGIQTWQVEDVFKSGSGTRNFRQFQPSVYPGDVDRAGRLSVRYQGASGLFSTRSAVKQIPLTGSDEPLPVVYGEWLPLHHRTREQYIGDGTEAAPKIGPGGGGYQFQRAYGYSAADPDYLILGQDISIIQHTKDFGAWWEHPPLNGMKVGVSAQCLWIDPENADRILALYSAGYLRGNSTNTNGWDQHTGMYLSTDRAKNWTLVDQIKGLGGSATNDPGETVVRYVQDCICHVPGGTPTTREIWAVAHIMHKGATTANALVRKSVNGGATWTAEATLSAATYGMPIVLRRAANGHWWLGTHKGLFKSTTNPGGTWTKITTGALPWPTGSMIYDIDVGGATNEVWVALGRQEKESANTNHGLWKTTTGGTADGSWTKILQMDIHAFAISPHDRDIILCAGNNGVTPRRSSNGGSSWGNITTNKFPGQPGGFEHLIHDTHAHFVFHKTDPNKVFAARYQHHGVSNNAGATFNWASANFDYNHLHDFNCDPLDWQFCVMAVTDRVAMATSNAHKWVEDDGADSAKKAELAAAAGFTGHQGNGRGALILRNGAHRAIFTALGNGKDDSVHIIRHKPNATSIIGEFTLPVPYYGVQWGNYGISDPTSNSRGYIGRTRLVLSATNTVTSSDMGKECIGIDAAGRVYGINKAAESSGGTVIYRTSNPGAATPTWDVWCTLTEQARPIDNDPRGISWDPTSPNGKILLSCKTRVDLAENGVARRVALVSSLVSGSWPSNQAYSAQLDPASSAAYISINRFGGPCVFKTNNINAATVVWTDITGDYCPKCPLKLFIHPQTSDIICGYHSGTFIYPAHVKQANSYYDTQWEMVSKYQL